MILRTEKPPQRICARTGTSTPIILRSQPFDQRAEARPCRRHLIRCRGIRVRPRHGAALIGGARFPRNAVRLRHPPGGRRAPLETAHLLAAVLRVQSIPTGLCYQRLTDDGQQFLLHRLVAIYLNASRHRLDPRGNHPGIDVQFSLETERLSWQARPEGERDHAQVFITPHQSVIAALSAAIDMLALGADGGLPSEP